MMLLTLFLGLQPSYPALRHSSGTWTTKVVAGVCLFLLEFIVFLFLSVSLSLSLFFHLIDFQLQKQQTFT